MTRAIILADSHGRPELITNVLKHSNYNPEEDRLIFAGDWIDIGPSSRECLDLLIRNKAELLWGNHELSVLLHHPINPQNGDSWLLFGRIARMRDQEKIKIAACHDNILITHAGLCSKYYEFFKDLTVPQIVEQLNLPCKSKPITAEDQLEIYWNDHSPVWFRPGKEDFYPNIKQIVGHTTLEYVKKYYPKLNLINFHIIDPYSSINFRKDRYRYAVIEDEEIKIFDSLF